ncbi:MAG: hypothetical protein F4X44_13375 [Gammaproteobacteria bacterium]|nr:hypothetical protein [Gammaproteobacteria bacterium]
MLGSSTRMQVANSHVQPELAEPNVPFWFRRHADIWIKIPGVKAVVLVGSQASGSANENSDWDVAIFHGESRPKEIPMHGEDFLVHHVDVPLQSLRIYIEESQSVGTLARETAVNGQILAEKGACD